MVCSPYPRRLKRLTIYRYNYKGSTFSSVILRPWQTRTHCCRHKCFPVCRGAQHLLQTNFVSGTEKMFLILFRNILCPQQMFPSLRSPRNIMGNNVSAKMCPRLPGPLGP